MRAFAKCRRKTARSWSAACVFAAGALFACGPKASDADRPVLAKPPSASKSERGAASSGLAAEHVARVPAGTFGPYLARRADDRLLVWAEASAGARKWRSVVLDAQGKPKAPAADLGPAPERIGLVALEATKSGYALLITHDTQPTQLEALELDASGKALGKPVELAKEPGEPLWVDWVETDSGPLALWALRKQSDKSDRADIFARGLRSAAAVPVVQQVRAWQSAALGSGAALAVVRATATELGPVDLLSLNGTGKVTSTAQLTTSASAEPDVDMVRVGEGLVLAWTDRSGLETRVVGCAVNAQGTLKAPPKALAKPRGDQALLRLVAPSSPSGVAFAVWEDAIDQLPDTRRLRVARIDASAALGDVHALLDFASVEGGVPELAASAKGLSALTLARPCERNEACDKAPVATLVELDAQLEPVLATPVTLAPLGGSAAPLAWGLSCGPTRCLVLAATDGAPAEVYAVRPDGAQSTWQPAAHKLERQPPPRLEAITTAARVDAPLFALSATLQKNEPLAAWLTFFDPTTPWRRLTKPAPDRRFDPPRATLQTGRLGSTQRHTISFRARSTGGVALASDGGAHGESLLVWSALDNQVPQVFATVLDAQGKKLRQQMVTRAKGEKLDVSVAAASDGWVVAWADERSGSPEVFATKINRFLQRAGPERRVGGKGKAVGALTQARAGDGILSAWVEGEGEGKRRVQVQALSSRDASAVGEAGASTPEGQDAFSPVLFAAKNGTWLGYLSRQTDGRGAVHLQKLAATGKVEGPAITARLGEDAAGLDVACAEKECHAVVVTAEGARGGLHAASFTLGAAPPRFRRVAAQSSAAIRSARPALVPNGFLVLDQSNGRGVVRHAEIKWK